MTGSSRRLNLALLIDRQEAARDRGSRRLPKAAGRSFAGPVTGVAQTAMTGVRRFPRLRS
jgi:hypothetical protein